MCSLERRRGEEEEEKEKEGEKQGEKEVPQHEAVQWVHPREFMYGASPSRQVQVCQGSHTAKALSLRDPDNEVSATNPSPRELSHDQDLCFRDTILRHNCL